MSPEAQRIAIAEACPEKIRKVKGYWQWFDGKWWQDCAPNREGYNDPLSDLNAMHEAEKVLTNNLFEVYVVRLLAITTNQPFHALNHQTNLQLTPWMTWFVSRATAAQRAEAFLRTLNLWDDSL